VAMWGRITDLASSVTGVQGRDAQQVGTLLCVAILLVARA